MPTYTQTFHRSAMCPTPPQQVAVYRHQSPSAIAYGPTGSQPEVSRREAEQSMPPAAPRPAQTSTAQVQAAPHVAAETLTQVAAAAAVAAAQAVKHDADSELSQVLKAVLLQQSRIGIANSALANAVGPGLLATLGQEKSIGPRVVGHRLTEPAPQPVAAPHSATPVVRFPSAHRPDPIALLLLVLIRCIASDATACRGYPSPFDVARRKQRNCVWRPSNCTARHCASMPAGTFAEAATAAAVPRRSREPSIYVGGQPGPRRRYHAADPRDSET